MVFGSTKPNIPTYQKNPLDEGGFFYVLVPV